MESRVLHGHYLVFQTLTENFPLQKNLNTMVATVSHIHITSAIKCHIPGALELSIVTALATKAARKCHVRF